MNWKLSPTQVATALGGEMSGDQVLAPGPGHTSNDRSLSIKVDPTAPEGFVVHSFAGDDSLACRDYVRNKMGLPPRHPDRKTRVELSQASSKSGCADYIYRLEDGSPYLRVRRRAGKEFFQQHWTGTRWANGAPKGPKVPYRLPELLQAEHEVVLIVEGEKDADNLAARGLTVTTNCGGAENWTEDLNRYFKNRDVYILPDNDEPGARHAKKVSDNLSGIAREVRVVTLPDLPLKGDVSNWLDAGGTVERLRELMNEAPIAGEGPRLLVSSADFVAGFTPPDYAIDGLVQRRYLYSLTANTGHGKTAVALLMAILKALGRPLAGREIDQGVVLYFAGENPDDVRARWIALCEVMGVEPKEADVHFMAGTGKLSEIATRVEQEVKELGRDVSLVIIDTSIAYFEGDDENSNVQAVRHAKQMRNLITLPGGPCVITLCHPVKKASREDLLPRGGGAFLNEVDGNLTCWNDGGTVTLHMLGKFRGPDFAPITFQLQSITSERIKDSRGRLMPTVLAKVLSKDEERAAEQQKSSDEDALLLAIADNPRASFAGLAVALRWVSERGENKAKVKRCADRLKKDKLVNPDRRGTLCLTEKGEAEVERIRLNRDLAGSRY